MPAASPRANWCLKPPSSTSSRPTGCAEAAETLERFPNVNGVVLNAAMPDESCRAFLQGVGATQPHVPRIVVGEPREADIPAELFVQGFAPAVLLDRLQGLYPAEFEAIEQQEERLRD